MAKAGVFQLLAAALAPLLVAAGPLPNEPVASPPLTPAQIYAKASPAVWIVQAAYASPSSVRSGGAVAIDHRSLATACHVVDGATSARITRDGGQKAFPVAQVTPDPDRARDLCLLTVAEDLPGTPAEIAPAASVAVGERVYAIGAPLGLEHSLTEGLVSGLRTVPGEALPDIQFSATTAPGSSGGGLFDDQGRLAGVTVSIASKESEGLSFAYPAEWVTELPSRVAHARHLWRSRLAADGAPIGPDGDAAASGFADLSDLSKIPLGQKPREGVQDAYRQFLLLAKPRAFLLTSDDRWGTVTDPRTLDAVMKDCALRGVSCRFYAIDDAVVWRP
jgi:S1-C subfamily serine protease